MNLRQVKTIEKKIEPVRLLDDLSWNVHHEALPGLHDILLWLLYEDWEYWKHQFVINQDEDLLVFLSTLVEEYFHSEVLSYDECGFILKKILILNFRFIGSEPYSCSRYYRSCFNKEQKENIRRLLQPYVKNLICDIPWKDRYKHMNSEINPQLFSLVCESQSVIYQNLIEDEERRKKYAQDYGCILKWKNNLSQENIDNILRLMKEQGINSFGLNCLKESFEQELTLKESVKKKEFKTD